MLLLLIRGVLTAPAGFCWVGRQERMLFTLSSEMSKICVFKQLKECSLRKPEDLCMTGIS